jgi:hypothetical protein
MLISKLYKERVKFFNKIVANFNNERISDLVVAYKISKIKFLKLQRHAKDYLYKSKEYSLINMTPNGRLAENRFDKITPENAQKFGAKKKSRVVEDVSEEEVAAPAKTPFPSPHAPPTKAEVPIRPPAPVHRTHTL